MANTTDLAHAVAAFLDGARSLAVAALLSDNDAIDIAKAKIAQALAVIDAGGDKGRDILIPFLTHGNDMVLCEAAKALHASRREFATPVLLDLHLTCVTEAHMVASWFLRFNGEPHDDGGRPLESYPHKYDDTLYREALERFDRSGL